MYLIVTHIPVYVSGSRTFVDDGWYADLLLTREFFGPRFGAIHLVGPSLPVSEAGSLTLHEVGLKGDDLYLYPSVDAKTRVRHFWFGPRKRWLHDIESLLRAATIVHTIVDDP